MSEVPLYGGVDLPAAQVSVAAQPPTGTSPALRSRVQGLRVLIGG